MRAKAGLPNALSGSYSRVMELVLHLLLQAGDNRGQPPGQPLSSFDAHLPSGSHDLMGLWCLLPAHPRVLRFLQPVLIQQCSCRFIKMFHQLSGDSGRAAPLEVL